MMILYLMVIGGTVFGQEAIWAQIRDGVIHAGGGIDISEWPDEAWAVIGDWTRYNEWMVQGLDGRDPVSAKHWEQFKDWRYEEPDWLVLVYDISLPWPLGSRDNKGRFRIDASRFDEGQVRFVMQDPPLMVLGASIVIRREQATDGRTLATLGMTLEISPLAMLFLDVPGFLEHMKYVMGIVRNNFGTMRGKGSACLPVLPVGDRVGA